MSSKVAELSVFFVFFFFGADDGEMKMREVSAVCTEAKVRPGQIDGSWQL